MANTIRAAKNTFGGGLVMDLSPDNTPNEVLTSALNATLATFNGNELQLQNDMGNGRVETARLPEGYIPVGTCEFGDIIYIVSYNPLTNRSQVGCFPSPERNISSEETGGTNQILQRSDFQELDENSKPTGRLKASSVKKILYNNKLYPGDKFIIYDKGDNITNNIKTITDVGNTTHQYGTFPKLLRIHVIAIEDSGKINFLDSTLRWYDNKYTPLSSDTDNSQKPADYFINKTKDGQSSNPVDIDSYRNLLSSGYSIFQSKISGKLALLIELEKITGFSCSYNVYGQEEIIDTNNIIKKKYKVYWNVSWETDDPNINPKYVVLTKSEWSGKDSDSAGKWYKWVVDEDHDGYKLGEGENGPALPACYDNDNYKYWTIGTSFGNFDITTRNTYENFINKYSYDKLLSIFLSTLYQNQSYYKDIPLIKLNIVRDASQLPILHQYYINANRLEYETNGGTIEPVLYTQLPNSGNYQKIGAVNIPDFIVNNYFHQPIYLEDTEDSENPDSIDFVIPIKQKLVNRIETQVEGSETTLVQDEVIGELVPDISNLIYNYELTPAMPYGLLSEYAIEGYIDFSKIGTGYINMTAWKYFIGENVFTLTLGLDAYVEDNMGIEEVVLEFYDNQPEIAAAYHLGNKESYSGQFTEVIPLNGSANTYKLQDIDSLNNQHHHLGNLASMGDTPVYKLVEIGEDVYEIQEADWETDKNLELHLNDCGTLYSNMLYLVKIVVKYCPLNALGEYDSTATSNYKYFYRWLWTAPIYNQYYHNTIDFEVLPLELTLDVYPQYSTTPKYFYDKFSYISDNTKVLDSGDDIYQYLSGNVQIVTSSDDVDFEKLEEQQEGGNEEVVDPLQLYINLTIQNNCQDGEDIVISGDNSIFVGEQEIKINVKGRHTDCANYYIANGQSMSFTYDKLEYVGVRATNSAIMALSGQPFSDVNKPEVCTYIKTSSKAVSDMYVTDFMTGTFDPGTAENPASCTIVVSDVHNLNEVNKCVEFTYKNPTFNTNGMVIEFPGNTVLSVDLNKIHITWIGINTENGSETLTEEQRLIGQTNLQQVTGAKYTVNGIDTQMLSFDLDINLATYNNGSFILKINFDDGAIITDHGKSTRIPNGSMGEFSVKFVNGNLSNG